MNKALMRIFTSLWLFSTSDFAQVRELPAPAGRALVRFETVFDEKGRHAVLVLTAAEKRANMTCFAELGAGKRNGSCDPVHEITLLGKLH